MILLERLPRVRGIYHKTPFAYFSSTSPRVRGDLPSAGICVELSVLSPPRARGSTSTKLPCACRGNVSPRARGSYLAYVFETVPVPGLPRVQGIYQKLTSGA